MTEEFPKMAELDYRGYHVDFLFDDAGQQAIAEFDNEIISFGAYNTWYKDEMKDIIDRKLDTICDSLNTFGAKLMYFDNAGYRDAKLMYRQRVMKIYLLADEYTEEEWAKVKEDMIEDSNKFLSETLCK